MKQCKYCGDSWVPEGAEPCYSCLTLKELLSENVLLARSVFDRGLLEAAFPGNRQRYVAILQELEATDEQ